MLRDIGACMSPFSAFQFIQGLETLTLRMREHCRNAQSVAEYLSRHEAVTRVIYPGMHRNKEIDRRASAYLEGGRGGLVGFELAGGVEAGRRFIDALKLVLSCRQYRRCALARHPSGLDDAFATFGRRAAPDRRHARLCAPVGRHRAY